MANISSPQSQAGIMSFYDAPSKGPKVNPRIIILLVVLFVAVVLMADHFAYLH